MSARFSFQGSPICILAGKFSVSGQVLVQIAESWLDGAEVSREIVGEHGELLILHFGRLFVFLSVTLNRMETTLESNG